MRYNSLLLFGMLILCLIFSACTSTDVPQNYVASTLVEADIQETNLHIQNTLESYQKIFIYPNKTIIGVQYIQTAEDTWETKTNMRIQIQGWDELAEILESQVLMAEGDVATLSVDQFIRYMSNLYP